MLVSLQNQTRKIQDQLKLFFLIFALACFGWFIQQQIIFNRDVSWLLEASSRLFNGGTYTNDFFENNPPWILYVYSLPVFIAKYFYIKINFAFQIYMFSLATFSLYICWDLLQKIFIENEVFIAKILLITIAFTFFVLPVTEFGQREHLLIILIFPYVLLITARLYGVTVNTKWVIAIGILAGTGFLIKPYFLPTFVLVELYYIYYQKRRTACLRLETIVILLMGILYAALILMRHQDYITEVLPFAWRWCGLAAHNTWSEVVFSYLVFYSFFAIVFLLNDSSSDRHSVFKRILLATLTGFLVSYFIQQTNWYYHQIPAIAVTLIIFIFLVSHNVINKNSKLSFSQYLVFILLLVQFCLYIKSYLEIVSFLPIAAFILVFVPGFIIMALKPERLRHGVFYLGLTFLILAPVLYVLMYNSYLGIKKKNEAMKWANFINQHASGQGVYFFTTDISYAFPVLMYSDAYSASRFSFFWGLGGLVKQSYLPMNDGLKQQLLTDKKHFTDMVVSDIQREKPKLIFVERSHYMNNLYFVDQSSQLTIWAKHRYIPFNYLVYFSSNADFKKVWQSYRYMTTLKSSQDVSNQTIFYWSEFMFDVYQRI